VRGNKLKLVILTALISAMCVLGSFIKIPSVITTVALDSAPAFISAAFLPPMFAGMVGALGHVATGLTSGFPLGPLHILIAVEMLVIVYMFALLHQKGHHRLKWVFALLANGVISAVPLIFIFSFEFAIAAVPGLFIGTLINLIVCAIVMPVVIKAVSRVKVMD